MSDRGRYLFAVTTGLDPAALDGQTGLQGAPLELVADDGLQAVVCDVELDEYGEQPVRQHLEQLDWVEMVARTHDSVVRAVAERATVAPMRLVTVCLDDESVRTRLREWRAPLQAALRRVEGCREWSVKAYQVSRDPEPIATPPGSGGSGAAYLQRKKEQGGRRARLDREAMDATEAVHAALAGSARASRLLAPQDPQLTGRPDRMLLNGAYLVPIADEAGFRACVDELRARHDGLLLEVAGPWAPYSFAVLDATSEAGR